MTVVAHLLLLCILAFFLLLFILPCVVTFRAIQILIFPNPIKIRIYRNSES